MTKNILITAFLLLPLSLFAQIFTPFERSDGTQTATYSQVMAFYNQLSQQYSSSVRINSLGPTDTDYPLTVVYYSNDPRFSPTKWHKEGKIILLINNGIHPGEPDGIDACMMLVRDAAMGKIKIPANVALAVIPVYNIGGALNRNEHSRANQNGPASYGFRGNAQNLDLNRDFIKGDARQTKTFEKYFQLIDPDIFIDNHVSDGADYQHIITLLATQHNKLGGATGKYMNDTFVPQIYKDMKTRGYDLVPYVNDFKTTPDKGWTEFYDIPRFSSGYAALFQTMAFVTETHMLKPYKQRVWATYDLMRSFIQMASKDAKQIISAKEQDRDALKKQTTFTLDWHADTTRPTMITFKGYEAGYKPSKISGYPRLYYDESKPYTKKVPFYNHFVPTLKATAPKAYVIQQGWHDVIDRLRWNGVHMYAVPHDTVIEVTTYHIDKYETVSKPYEKHYLHHDVTVTPITEDIKLLKGDLIIPVDQSAKRYLVETLEPNAPDAFFAWNFFDAILQEKEYYSDYVFEDEAAALLSKDPQLQQMLDAKKEADTAFAHNGAAQLYFVYKHSAYFEPEYMRYPVFRIE